MIIRFQNIETIIKKQLLIELFTGMRMGEINALKPENIDFKKKADPYQTYRIEREGLIFYDYNKGNIVTTSQVNSFYKRICAKCNLEDNGQHVLRHTFATRCIEAGIPPAVIKNWLRHKDIHITLDTYADVFDRMNFSAVSKLERYIDALEEVQEQIV